jgi:MFS-type transporter involved in bile tolerance (Atg22 family)
MEIFEQFTDPILIAAVMAIVGLIKDRWIFRKINTKFISVGISIILVTVLKFVTPSPELVVTIEDLLLIVLPAVGYDYIYQPIVKPILDLFRKKDSEEIE